MDQIFTAGILLSVVGGLLYYLKSVPNLIMIRIKRHFIYTARVYQYDELFYAIESWLFKNYPSKYKDVEVCTQEMESSGNFPSQYEEGKPKDKLFFKQEDSIFFIKYKGKKLIIEKKKEKLDKAQSIKEIHFCKYSISGWSAKSQIEKFLNEILKENIINKKDDRIKIYTNNQWGETMLLSKSRVKPVDKIILNKYTKDLILNDLKEFTDSKNWYYNTNIPYKRGYCFYGPPGTGKTSLALSIASHLEKNIVTVNLNNLDNDGSLTKLFSYIQSGDIILIEDIDSAFSGRESVKEKISFSTILNCLDGAMQKEGNILIITTNHIDKLDPALLRAGRIDLKVEIPCPSKKEVSEYISLFFDEKITVPYMDEIYSMAQIQEMCISNKTSSQTVINKLTGQIFETV